MPASLLILEGWDEYALLGSMAKSIGIKTAHLVDQKRKPTEYAQAAIALVVSGRDRAALTQQLKVGVADATFKKIGLIFDSEENPDATAQKLKDAINSLDSNLRANKVIQTMQLPSESEKGSLETLCLDTLDKKDIFVSCAQSFLDCIQPHSKVINTQAQKDKVKLAAWHAAKTGEPLSAFKYTKELDFEHIKFKPIIQLLQDLSR